MRAPSRERPGPGSVFLHGSSADTPPPEGLEGRQYRVPLVVVLILAILTGVLFSFSTSTGISLVISEDERLFRLIGHSEIFHPVAVARFSTGLSG